MIQRDKILAQLQGKKDRFIQFDSSFRNEARSYDDALGKLGTITAAELRERLANDPAPGALPVDEFDKARSLCLKFPREFANHKEARDWAFETLLGHTTFAVDGSQIRLDSDYTLPVAAVQVAWFENRHTRESDYEKQAEFEILSPDDLMIEIDGERQVSEQQVNVRRFELEIAAICRLMQQIAAHRKPGDKLPLALFDSSLVISFADRLQDQMRTRHIEAMIALLRCSEATGVPVVGYVDSSDARDLTHMLERCFNLPKAERIHDAAIAGARLGWGDRTPGPLCARRGADQRRESVLEVIERDGHQIGFAYLRTTASSSPARLDFPLWVYERGLLDEVVDLVRAEVIVGNGYPYAIEAADAAAVITARDREAFYALFQRFADTEGIQLRITQKATSKDRRR